MNCKLIITIPLDNVADDEDAIQKARGFFAQILTLPKDSLLNLIRDGDRSGLNLLLPKIEGRMGSHYQGRKAKIDEVFPVLTEEDLK